MSRHTYLPNGNVAFGFSPSNFIFKTMLQIFIKLNLKVLAAHSQLPSVSAGDNMWELQAMKWNYKGMWPSRQACEHISQICTSTQYFCQTQSYMLANHIKSKMHYVWQCLAFTFALPHLNVCFWTTTYIPHIRNRNQVCFFHHFVCCL